MNSPEEYVDAQCAGPERPAMVTHEQATAAVRQALLDAERYKNNLVGALRRSGSPAATQAILKIFDENDVPDSGTVQLGTREMPWRVASSGDVERLQLNPSPHLPSGEEPPF